MKRKKISTLLYLLFFTLFPNKAVFSIEPYPLTKIAEFKYKPTSHKFPFYNNKIYFSQYDKSGNDVDVISFDLATQKEERLIVGEKGARFVAENDKYLIYRKRVEFAPPLIIKDRHTGKILNQIKLKHDISWAKIIDNKLIAIQDFVNKYTNETEMVILDIPTLKVIKSGKIKGGKGVALWQDKILSLGSDLIIYDNNLNEVSKIKVPYIRKTGACYKYENQQIIYENKAIIRANCGDLLIYNLLNNKLELTINAKNTNFKVIKNLIFTNSHVYNIETGKVLATFSIPGELYTSGNKLISIDYNFVKPTPITIYDVNIEAILNGGWQHQQVISKCTEAESYLNNNGNTHAQNLYKAIDFCASTGIEKMIDRANIIEPIYLTLKKYSIWLSETFSYAKKSISLLEKLNDIKTDEQISNALLEAQVKVKILNQKEPLNFTDSEKSTDVAKIAIQGDKIKSIISKDIDYSDFSRTFHITEDKIYIGRWVDLGGGTFLGVYDRKTFNKIKDVHLIDYDGEMQDSVKSIASDDSYIYVSVEPRYKRIYRPNFFIIDKKANNIVKETHIENIKSLIYSDNKLFSCGCHFIEKQQCKIINLKTLETQEKHSKFCVYKDIATLNKIEQTHPHLVAETRNFYVQRKGYKDKQYNIHSKSDGSIKTVEHKVGESINWPYNIYSDDNYIFLKHMKRLTKMNAETGEAQVMNTLRAPRRDAIAIYGNYLFFGYGKHLAIHNLKENRIEKIIRHVIQISSPQYINRLIIDNQKLIVLTYDGKNSKIIPMQSLLQAIK